MRLIVDSNVLFAALLKDSHVRTALFYSIHEFFIPAYVLHELEEHKIEIMEKTGYSEQEFQLIVSSVLQKVSLIDDASIQKKMEEAKIIMDSIDPDDTPIIAAALAIGADGVVTFDSHFRQQNAIRVYDAEELMPKGEV